jgi:hypothetical protein
MAIKKIYMHKINSQTLIYWRSKYKYKPYFYIRPFGIEIIYSVKMGILLSLKMAGQSTDLDKDRILLVLRRREHIINDNNGNIVP